MKFQDESLSLVLKVKVQQRLAYEFSKDELSEQSPTKLSPMSLLESSQFNSSPKFFSLTQLQNKKMQYYSKLLVDLQESKEDGAYYLNLIAASNLGTLEILDLSWLKLGSAEVPFLEHSNCRQNYNPYRQSREDYLASINTHKVVNFLFHQNSIHQSHEPRKRTNSRMAHMKTGVGFRVVHNTPFAKV